LPFNKTNISENTIEIRTSHNQCWKKKTLNGWIISISINNIYVYIFFSIQSVGNKVTCLSKIAHKKGYRSNNQQIAMECLEKTYHCVLVIYYNVKTP